MDSTQNAPTQSAPTQSAPTQAPNPWLIETPPELESWVHAALARHTLLVSELGGGGSSLFADSALRRYDDAVAILSITGSQLSLLNSVHPSREIRDTAQSLVQIVAEAGVALGLNRSVYEALSAVSLPESGPEADPAANHYLQRTLLSYRLAGVDRDEPTRDKLRELHERATALSLTFSRNVQESLGTVLVDSPEELAGLPEDFLAGHQPASEGEHAGKIVLTTNFPDYLPVMTFARDAGLRRRMFLAYQTRAFPANVAVLQDLLTVRREIAVLLGFPTWADLATADQMMESSANMQQFLDQLDHATRDGALREYQAVLAFARQSARAAGEPELAAIDAAGRGFWLEQYRRDQFSFDSQSVRPYFPYDKVQAGVLSLVEELFRVRFAPVTDAETWHPSVTTWDVFGTLPTSFATDANPEPSPLSSTVSAEVHLGRFYLDMHPREGKDKWFSAAPLVPGVRGLRVPEAALICNFPGGAIEDPGLLQHSDVITFLHEFGHLMHAILGGHQAWAGLSGIATEGDFVEVPSQMLEEFFRDPTLLARFAHHYQSGEPIPSELVERMNRAGAFGRADSVRTQLFYTSYSLDTHRLDPATLDLDALLREDYSRFLPYEWVDGNRLYASFTHLTGYSSNYYTYLYDKVIALDFFREFTPGNASKINLLDPAITTRYREEVLAPGGSKPGKDLVRAFLGREQSPEAFTAWLEEALHPS